jgi:DNA-binding MarR family transcriptional regulator
MSAAYGMLACVLIRVDARAGTWVSVQELARHLGCGSSLLCRHLQAMAEGGLVQVRRNATDHAIEAVRSTVPAARATAWEARQ